jgi:hypothetical protein
MSCRTCSATRARRWSGSWAAKKPLDIGAKPSTKANLQVAVAAQEPSMTNTVSRPPVGVWPAARAASSRLGGATSGCGSVQHGGADRGHGVHRPTTRRTRSRIGAWRAGGASGMTSRCSPSAGERLGVRGLERDQNHVHLARIGSEPRCREGRRGCERYSNSGSRPIQVLCSIAHEGHDAMPDRDRQDRSVCRLACNRYSSSRYGSPTITQKSGGEGNMNKAKRVNAVSNADWSE